MNVAILSEHIYGATRIFSEVSKIHNCCCDILLFNKSPVRLVRQLGYIVLRTKPPVWLKVLSILITGRLRIFFGNFKSTGVQNKIKKLQYDIGLHNLGVIYTNEMIQCFKRGILNSHIGLLPRYRGRCVMEWSLFEKAPTGITVFYIDEGIDTGKEIVIREEVSVKECNSIKAAKDKLFSLDGVFYAKAVEAEINKKAHLINDGSGPRFYVMSKKLLDIVEKENFCV